jgi:hypothetical protein
VKTPKVKHVNCTRAHLEIPEDIPEEWEIHNAARPIVGTETWRGPFIHGIFYAAVDPESKFADSHRKRNAELDATELHFVDADSLIEIGMEYYRTEWADKVKDIDPENDNHRTSLIRRALKILDEEANRDKVH